MCHHLLYVISSKARLHIWNTSNGFYKLAYKCLKFGMLIKIKRELKQIMCLCWSQMVREVFSISIFYPLHSRKIIWVAWATHCDLG